ncbi:hypothetical protein M426DRAFT_13947 [Hypoxylon sp. CI-4A]|nr:hypothetical protein M426DRAFT_13947 [Hypoxylon sp. CI-4A]
MPSTRKTIRHNGRPVGLVTVDQYHTEVDFKKAFEFLKDTMKEESGGVVSNHRFNDLVSAAFRDSDLHGKRGRYPISWLAAKILDELWNLTNEGTSPWYELLNIRLSAKQLNSEDDDWIYYSYIAGSIQRANSTKTETVEEILHEYFDNRFPMLW